MRLRDIQNIVAGRDDLIAFSERCRQFIDHINRAMLSTGATKRGIGGKRPRENRLISYLLFEQKFTREMIDLGYRDAMNVKADLLDFVSGADVPRLFAPSWVKQDLGEAT